MADVLHNLTGKLQPGNAFKEASIPLSANLGKEGFSETPGKSLYYRGVHLQAHPDNQRPLYICVNAKPPNLENYNNVRKIIKPGESVDYNPGNGTIFSPGAFFLGAENGTDFAIGYVE